MPQPKDVNLLKYCPDINEWPQSWAGFPDVDVPLGQKIVEEFKPFLLDLIDKNRAKGTVKKYADYLWALGGILIRRVNDDNKQRKLSPKKLILNVIDEVGGPLWPDARNERDHIAYDSACRLLYKFLSK